MTTTKDPLGDALKTARAHMEKAIESSRHEFSTIRSNKATTSLLDLVRVHAYGNLMPLNQVASVAARRRGCSRSRRGTSRWWARSRRASASPTSGSIR